MVRTSEVEVMLSWPEMVMVFVTPFKVMVSANEKEMTWAAVGKMPRVKVPVWKTMSPGADEVTLPLLKLYVSPDGARIVDPTAVDVMVMGLARAEEQRQREGARMA